MRMLLKISLRVEQPDMLLMRVQWPPLHTVRANSRAGWFVAALSLFLAALPAPAAAQNRLVNPDLNANLNSWDLGPATMFDPTRGSPTPGSALFQGTVAAPFDIDNVVILDQCVDGIIPGATYSFGGRLLLTAVPGGAIGGIGVIWKSIPCGGAASDIGLEVAPPVSTTGAFQITTWSAVAPAGAVAADFNVITGIAAIGPGPITDPSALVFVPGSYEVNADSLFLHVGPPQPFTDDKLTAGATAIKAVHITELRTRIDALRARYGLPTYAYTNSSIVPGTSVLSVVDILDLRTALAQVYTATGLTPPNYTTSPGAGVAILVADIANLRSNVVAIE